MIRSVTDALPWWLLFMGLVVGLLLVVEGTFLLAARYREKVDKRKKAHANLVLGSLLTILGLLLGFSFGIANSRFDTRKELVLEEANAIGTTYLRADMLPPERVETTRELLRCYVDIRLSVTSEDDLKTALATSESIHDSLWSEAVASSQEDPDSRYIPLFVQSLNDVIDLQESRVTYGVHFRLPTPLLFTLLVLAVIAAVVVGVVLGSGGSRSFWPTLAMVGAVAVVLTLIIELDRPWNQLFTVSQEALFDLQETMADDSVVRGDCPTAD